MKKYLLLFIFLAFAFTSHSQILITLLLGDKLNSEGLSFGLTGGFNFTNISGMETTNWLENLNLGFYFDIQLKNNLWINTGVQVKSNFGVDKLTTKDLEFLGTQTYEANGDCRQVVNAFVVPVQAKYKFKNYFYIEAGPQFALMYDAFVRYDLNEDNRTARIKENNKDMIRKIDAGLGGGIGYQLMKGKGMAFGINYYHGFTNVYKERGGTRNSSINLKVNIPIGAQKAEGNGDSNN